MNSDLNLNDLEKKVVFEATNYLFDLADILAVFDPILKITH